MKEVLQTCDFCVASTASAHSCEVNQLTGKARISDVIRSRFNAWKPDKSQAQRIPAKLEMFKKLQEITGLQLEQRRDLGGAETAKDSKK